MQPLLHSIFQQFGLRDMTIAITAVNHQVKPFLIVKAAGLPRTQRGSPAVLSKIHSASLDYRKYACLLFGEQYCHGTGSRRAA